MVTPFEMQTSFHRHKCEAWGAMIPSPGGSGAKPRERPGRGRAINWHFFVIALGFAYSGKGLGA
jgi:hypothetical protein